jgi:Tfp pilus assembly protein PilF
MPGVLEFAQAQYATKAEAAAAIRELTSGVEDKDQPAQRHALLARLYYRAGNGVMARWSYEQALTGGLELPILKNDLAFLLASQKRDLERARILARQAAEELSDQAGAFDTLGFVLLQLEDYTAAAREIRRGIDIATKQGAPQSELQYHLGLALIGLDKMNEAESAFVDALESDESFPDEEAAREELARLRGEI